MSIDDRTPDVISDPVDWAAHFWDQQALDGDERRFLTLTSLLRYQRIVADAVDVKLKAHGLNMTDYLLLMTLLLSETGTRLISALARNLLVHATTETLATDRLESRDLLERSPHPTDRRATCVTITDKGRDAARAVTSALTADEFGMHGGTDQDVEQLRAALTAMRQSVGDA
ncbi:MULTISPECIES: MarR family winged helix-turn-helix transcriptional regulator [Gordonia]|uniref:MarR family transcriptional regulator n=1 Tax=Gordonia amicalis TaxID=89053 RepID=A0ABU4DHD5_9ACTN|nr:MULTISPECIES: MarR family transcriptional regulator [Gordonia]ATD69562.1 MarR family transcriptional regulator [Gordonia sp. 1D]MDJ0453281.1 MarR family transcriptional regulator [Gordonia amicalis]MDV6309163.1 MarR family transcriptional regulator [Gordonia amicalis]MDV7076299.1 MarR family transcriptional regulator [Gordonia amicalis]MDV7099521.1 MarR family transcriptional regulator [Gordonia amicalis]